MPFALHSLAAAIPGFFHLGRLQLPIFGIIATAGLVSALVFSQRTAPLAGLDANRLWDAGVLAVVSAFVASRLLLVAVNLGVFLAHPLLVLAQPSLTFGGLVLTALIVWLWLRRHGLPLLRVLDAWAAPAALLAAALQLGHFAEGTDAGMPTTLPWGVSTRGDLAFGRVHPVQLYAVVAYLSLCWWLLRLSTREKALMISTGAKRRGETPVSGRLSQPRSLLVRHTGVSPLPETVNLSRFGRNDGTWVVAPRSARDPFVPGRVAAFGLLAGATLSFLLSFFRQPFSPYGSAYLDPGQYASLAALVAGAALFFPPRFAPPRRAQPLILPGEPC